MLFHKILQSFFTNDIFYKYNIMPCRNSINFILSVSIINFVKIHTWHLPFMLLLYTIPTGIQCKIWENFPPDPTCGRSRHESQRKSNAILPSDRLKVVPIDRPVDGMKNSRSQREFSLGTEIITGRPEGQSQSKSEKVSCTYNWPGLARS